MWRESKTHRVAPSGPELCPVGEGIKEVAAGGGKGAGAEVGGSRLSRHASAAMGA